MGGKKRLKGRHRKEKKNQKKTNDKRHQTRDKVGKTPLHKPQKEA